LKLKLGRIECTRTTASPTEFVEIKSKEGNAIYFLAGILFLFMQLKNESKCFNLIKNEASWVRRRNGKNISGK
jgi:hypothetical protein